MRHTMKYYKNYRTPIQKLCKILLESRNKWKLKCKIAKNEIKNLSNKNRYSKNRIKVQNMRISELENELSQAKKQLANYPYNVTCVDINFLSAILLEKYYQ